jgi:N-methylhydantoinase B/oxoprolinase/acetone carboxylase alpha subunit
MSDELDELVSKEVRRKMARNMAKLAKKSSTKIKKERSAKKIASPEKIKSKAHKKAKNFFVNKLTGGKAWSTLSDQEKMAIEKKLAKKKAVIDKLAKKLAKQVKKDDRIKVKAKRAAG